MVAPLKEEQVIVLSLAPVIPGLLYTELQLIWTTCVAVVVYPTFDIGLGI